MTYGPGTQNFGLVSVGVLVSLILLVAAAVWVAQNRDLVPMLWARLRNVAAVTRAEAWAREKLHDRGWSLPLRWPLSEVAGVALLVGLAVVVALGAGFTEVLDDVLEGDGIAGIDQPAARWLATHRDLWLTTALRAITGAGGGATLGAVAAIACAAASWASRSWAPVVFGLAGAGGITLVLFTAKALVVRDRPPLPFGAIAADGYSFPSGHAAGAAAGAGLFAWMLTRWLVTRWAGRVAVWAAAIGIAAVLGFSRVYLGVHYISDVVAGWLLGAAWAGAVMVVGSWWDNTRRARARQLACGDETA
ncbi:phosphatase PAP2 family protein [Mycobacterium xenopi]|nr:phosphatase PAP2 family protein [Mycobacterium xenopi]MDA3637958.1 phosphatase PAP2 family protein [Mycobacterium xenopi]